MSRSILDILFVLAILAFMLLVQPLILGFALMAHGTDNAVRALADWTGTRENEWILYGVWQLATLIPCFVFSFAVSMLFRVNAISVALIAAVSALLAMHLAYDNFDFSGLVAVKLLEDLFAIIGILLGVLLATHVRRKRREQSSDKTLAVE